MILQSREDLHGAIEEITTIIDRMRERVTGQFDWFDSSVMPRENQGIIVQFNPGSFAFENSEGDPTFAIFRLRQVRNLSIVHEKWSGGAHWRDVDRWTPMPKAPHINPEPPTELSTMNFTGNSPC